MGAPPTLDALRDAVMEAGYRVDGPVRSESFGDEQWIFDGACLRIRAASDRGHWSLQLTPASEPDWFTVEVWQSCLEGRDPTTDEESFERQVAFAVGNLDRLEGLVSDDAEGAEFVRCLYRARDKRGELLEELLFGTDPRQGKGTIG